MKIIYFSLDYTPHDHRFLSALAETEHEIFYVRLQRGPRQTEDRPVPARINQVSWTGGRDIFRWRNLAKYVIGLRRIIRDLRPDLIHAGPIQTCGLIGALTGFHPLLIMSWGFDLMEDSERNGWWRRVTKFVLRCADAFTSDCEATHQKAIGYGMNPDRTVVFPWGVDLQHFQPERSNHRSSSRFTIFCNRSWEPRYGVDVLAKAFVKVANQRSNVDLLLLGGGSQGQVIQKILERGGVLDRVMFVGQVSQADLPRYYHMASLYVSASHVDGSSVSLMEALACGLPVIISDIPANKEWVDDEVNGWVFPDGNAGALAARILQNMENPKAMQKMGEAARITAETRANWKTNFLKLLDAYQIAVAYRKERKNS
jgi:glycosyltransferase involved in cell wall biosynthesis